MKKISVLIFVLFSFSSFSQTKEQTEKQQQKESEIQNYVRIADSCFVARDFLTAKAQYLNALALKHDVSVQKRIKEIDATIQFEEYIQQADELFALKAYRDALEFYERALAIKATATYPVDQILKIDWILYEQSK